MSATTPAPVAATKDPAFSLICESCIFTGSPNLGQNNVFNHQVRIDCSLGPVTIGRDNIFEDRTSIDNKTGEPLIIGDGNVFGIGCLVEGSVGSRCSIEPRGRVKAGAKVGDRVVVGPMCVAEGEVENGTSIYGIDGGQRTLVQSEAVLANADEQKMVHLRHVEYLRDVIPRYNKTRVQ